MQEETNNSLVPEQDPASASTRLESRKKESHASLLILLISFFLFFLFLSGPGAAERALKQLRLFPQDDRFTERTKRPMNHVRNFFDCVKSRQPTVANPEVMHRSMSTVHAANICMWLKRDMFYDPVKEEFLNDAEANRLRSRAQREPWII
jgi:hypothetical protein